MFNKKLKYRKNKYTLYVYDKKELKYKLECDEIYTEKSFIESLKDFIMRAPKRDRG